MIKLIRFIYSYIDASSKRKAEYKHYQRYYNIKENQIFKLCGTRWLELFKCVCRILVNKQAIEHYFTVEVDG